MPGIVPSMTAWYGDAIETERRLFGDGHHSVGA